MSAGSRGHRSRWFLFYHLLSWGEEFIDAGLSFSTPSSRSKGR
jgi:hypothetical protein